MAKADGTTVTLEKVSTEFQSGDSYSKQGTNDKYVRYAWSNFVQCVLRNNNSLPLGPFLATITDDRELHASKPQPQINKPVPSTHRNYRDGVITAPPLGFNSWNFYHCNIDENEVKEVVYQDITLEMTGYR